MKAIKLLKTLEFRDFLMHQLTNIPRPFDILTDMVGKGAAKNNLAKMEI